MFYVKILIGFTLILSQSDRLLRKTVAYQRNGYKIKETKKITTEFFSSLPHINNSHDLKLRIPILHVEFLYYYL